MNGSPCGISPAQQNNDWIIGEKSEGWNDSQRLLGTENVQDMIRP